MSDEVYLELLRYRRIIVLASLLIGAFWAVALLSASCLKEPVFTSFIIGGLIGSTLAVINVFALGYAAYLFFIKKTSSSFIFGPFLSFGALLGGALYTVFYYAGSVLGFALGLCSPLILGAAIAFFEDTNTVER